MTYQNKIADFIIRNIEANSKEIVAMCGAADIGKTNISKELIEILNSKGVSANHITLDSFLVSRAKRIKSDISGYDIEAYDSKSIIQLLKDFKLGKSISYFPYDHATGDKTNKHIEIGPCRVLIIDGLHSMHEKHKGFYKYSIFVYTEDKKLRRMRREADIVKRKKMPEVSLNLEPGEFEKYKRKIEPYKDQADLLLFLKRKWDYSLEIILKK